MRGIDKWFAKKMKVGKYSIFNVRKEVLYREQDKSLTKAKHIYFEQTVVLDTSLVAGCTNYIMFLLNIKEIGYCIIRLNRTTKILF